MHEVWAATLDGRWKCRVVRVADYTGRLEIFDGDSETPCHSEEVGLSYNAAFGPDVMDVNDWQRLSLNFVDDRITVTVEKEKGR